jgi:hypothetical protein
MCNHVRKVSALLGIVLLLCTGAGGLKWAGRLADPERYGFDAGGLALLGLTAGLLVAGILLLRRALARREWTNDGVEDPGRHPTDPVYVLAVAGCVLVLAVLAGWHVTPLLVAKPSVPAGNLATANRIGKPTKYGPDRNAAPYYERLRAQFVPVPATLRERWQTWPADLSSGELRALEEWAPANMPLLSCLSQATQYPYCWYELTSEDGSLLTASTPDLGRLRECAEDLVLLAKYQAGCGKASGALSLLADLYVLGFHHARNGVPAIQLAGLDICEMTYDAMRAVPAHSSVDQDALRRTLTVLAPRLAQIRVPRFSSIEHLYGRARIQHAFTNDQRGNGTLIPGQLYFLRKNHPGFYRRPIPYLDAVWTSLTHPDRQETILLFEEYFTAARRLAAQTPWELHAQHTSHEDRLIKLLARNYFLLDGFGTTGHLIRLGWRGRIEGEATVAVLAILTYRAQEGRLPESLRQLVEAGLLTSVPVDPYSGVPLVYRVTDRDFTLYSAGEDFVDNGGTPGAWGDTGRDCVFWPVGRSTKAAAGEK